MRALGRGFAAALLAGLLAGCASGGTGAEPAAGDRQGIAITVQNDAPGGSTVTVSVVPDVGVRRTLGQVPFAESRTFPYDGIPGSYRLIALGDAGGERQSETFRIFANSHVRWTLSTNNVTVSGR